MLGDKNAGATVAVRDLEAATEFYGKTLGLKEDSREGSEAVVYRTGTTKMLVYRSQYAGTNKATAVTWEVGDVEGTVRALRSKGVKFEHYQLPGLTIRGDVHVGEGMEVAWFKDPDGNIHALVSG